MSPRKRKNAEGADGKVKDLPLSTVPPEALAAADEAVGDAEPEGEEPQAEPPAVEPEKKRGRGRPRLTDAEKAARRAARIAEEQGLPSPREWARSMMKSGYQGASEVLFSQADEQVQLVKRTYGAKYPEVTTLPDTLALTDEEADSLAAPTEMVIDKWLPGLLDKVGPELMLVGTLASISYQRWRTVREISRVVQAIQERERPAVVHQMPGTPPEGGSAPPA